MESENGSLEPRGKERPLVETSEHHIDWVRHMTGRMPVVPVPALTREERDRIADGEPYCFRCGRPASSFEEYDYDFAGGDRADYVRDEEGTYNPETNRFACDACYIAIGMPAGPDGWRAP